MAEQTFKSPGFFEREIEVIKRPFFRNTATPVGLVGPAQRGPAFVPTTVNSREEFIRIFGAPQRRSVAGHAMAEFFRNSGKALTFCRTLGAGGTRAGFSFEATAGAGGAGVVGKKYGAVHFLVAQHQLDNAEFLGLGSFNDNDSHTTDMDDNPNGGLAGAAGDGKVELIRAMIFTDKNHAVFVSPITTDYANDVAAATNGVFKIKVESNANPAVETFEAEVSLDPERSDYISKVLNTDPLSLAEKGHFLYAHFPVDDQVAAVGGLKVAILHGTDARDQDFANFNSEFTAPETPKFISQPFGRKEYELFHFESLDDGAYASSKYKVSISNLRASTDPTDEFGTFSVSIRDLRDTDESPIVFETFSNCSLNPHAENFIGRVIGDQKVYFDKSASSEDERRLVREGSFANVSTRVRVVLSDDILREEVPATALPFGFRGVKTLLLNDNGTDSSTSLFADFRDEDPVTNLNKCALPPLPYRFKVTKGDIRTGGSAGSYEQSFTGQASPNESVDLNLYWGLMSNRVTNINNANASSTEFNELLENYTKFMSAASTVVSSGSIADSHNNNKFSLAKVSLNVAALSDVSGTINDVFKNAVYVRNADAGNTTLYDAPTHTIKMTADPDAITGTGELANAVSLAKLLAEDPTKFNKYNLGAKFTAPFQGGFDGLNMFDADSFYMTDKGLSTEAGGHSHKDGFASAIKGTLLTDTGTLMQGAEDTSNIVLSYKNAIRLMTDDLVVNHNVLALPGVRDPFLTDFAKQRVEDYGKALYLMDIQYLDKDGTRVFVDEKGIASGRVDVDQTAETFDAREVNSSYVASYFPDAMVLDSGDDDAAAINSRRSVRVPSSVIALGALAKNDEIEAPWFAPAGFSRGALETITSTDVRLNAEDRDTLYEARINPIANFPNRQFVIFGQKTAQLARTALDRVNVRRLVLEVKRQIEVIAQGLLFEQNNKATRDRFIQSAGTQLAGIQLAKGIEDFRVVMDSTNNTSEDVDNNRLNGKIVIVPTRAIEFIAIDFVITNAGVEFP